MVAESDVCIEMFLTSTTGFRAVFKQRFSDFVVQEVQPNGDVTTLTSTEYSPSAPVEESTKPSTGPAAKSEDKPVQYQERLEKIVRIVEVGLAEDSPSSSDGYFDVCTEDDKTARKDLHQFLRQKFPGTETTTVSTPENSKLIRIRKAGRPGQKRQRRPPDAPPRFREWVAFVLYKENTDTTDAIARLSRMLHIPQGSFTYAGTKDRRAVTMQRVCVRGVTPERLASLNKSLNPRIRIGNFDISVGRALHLGDLKGNRFSIVLRDLEDSATDARILDAVSALREHGFVNYFGLQRFGSGANPTHKVGFLILKGDFKEAVRTILDPLDPEATDDKGERRKDREQAMNVLGGFLKGSLKAPEAFEAIPRSNTIERMILEAYSKEGKSEDHRAALAALPRNLRNLYAHSVQSYLFNFMASERLRMAGSARHAVRGDLVLAGPPAGGEGSCGELADVHVVTGEEEAAQKFSIKDIVLPLIGTRSQMPANTAGSLALDLMKSHGVDLRAPVEKEYAFPGDYRRLIAEPKDVEVEILQNLETAVELDPVGLDDEQEHKRAKLASPDESASTERRALRLSFTLGPSQYATMCIRELCKQDSSTLAQKQTQQRVAEQRTKNVDSGEG